MAILLAIADFKGGKYDIPDAGIALKAPVVQNAIDLYETQAIYELLGVAEGNLFIAWVQANFLPANTDYSKIKDPFAEDDLIGFCIQQSKGMKEYLKAYVFYQYVKNGLVNGHAGVFNTNAETADKASPAGSMRFAEAYYNGELDTAHAIQWYCRKTPAAFPNFNGLCLDVKYSSLL